MYKYFNIFLYWNLKQEKKKGFFLLFLGGKILVEGFLWVLYEVIIEGMTLDFLMLKNW
jgi:hypothetical protein